jgi:arginine repressor
MSSTGTKQQLESQEPQDHLFEEETKLEQSGVSFRLIAIMAVIVAIGAGIAYYFVSQRKDLSAAEATPAIVNALRARGPAVIAFKVGHVEPSVSEKPRDPHYRLLEKAGIITIKDDKKGGIYSAVTPDGERLVSALAEFKKLKNTDGTQTYVVPLASREIVSVDRITPQGVNAAHVDFTWRWKPNVLGQRFDASGELVHKFNTWDRATLIKDYGVDFFGETKKSSTYMVRGEKGWEIGTEE